MTRLEDIQAAAKVFAGRITDAQASILERLCAAADLSLSARLREDIHPEDCYDSYVCAAAWIALSGFSSAANADGVEAFTAGTLTVRRASGASNCLAMQAEVMMAPYVRDGGFSFLEV